jgi:hypothetical protein
MMLCSAILLRKGFSEAWIVRACMLCDSSFSNITFGVP